MPSVKAKKRTQTAQEVADELDLNEKVVRGYCNRKPVPCPHSRRGNRLYLDVAEVRAWMESQGLTGEAHRPRQHDSPDIEAARLRKENALARKYELQVAKEEAGLLDAEAVQRIWTNLARVVRNKIEGLGGRVAARCVGRTAAEVQKIIDEEASDALSHLSRHGGDEVSAAA